MYTFGYNTNFIDFLVQLFIATVLVVGGACLQVNRKSVLVPNSHWLLTLVEVVL